MKRVYTTAFAFFFSIILSAQTTIALVADKDNSIYSAFTGNSNGAGQYLFAGRNAGSNNNSVQRALLHFNLSTLPAGAVVTAATLTVYTDRTAPVATAVNLYRASADWGEGTSDASDVEAAGTAATTGDATWLHRLFPGSLWATPGGSFSSTVSASANVDADVRILTAIQLTGSSVIADVQSWVTNPAVNFGWFITAGNEVLAPTVKRFFSRNSSVASQRPVLNITYTTSLPVNLKRFEATLLGNQALLQWTTASENNNAYFEIERSTNAVMFAPIGKVTGNNNTVVEQAYSFTDRYLAPGKNYYRLAQYDNNGAVKYSHVITVSARSTATLQIKPNPVANVLHLIAASFSADAYYFITSASGQTVKKGSIINNEVGVQSLSAGQYWLTIQSSGKTIQSSFIKN